MPRPKKFKEASKVLTLRVPISKFDEYKGRFKFIVEGNDKGDNFPFKTLSKKAFKEIDNLLASIKLALSKKGHITTSDFNYLLEATDFGHNKKARAYFKE